MKHMKKSIIGGSPPKKLILLAALVLLVCAFKVSSDNIRISAEDGTFEIPSKELLEKNRITTTTPSGTTVNLFDYWIHDSAEANDFNDKEAAKDAYKNGFNAGRPLVVTSSSKDAGLGNWNTAFGDTSLTEGIVQNELGISGIPVLNFTDQTVENGDISQKVYDNLEDDFYLPLSYFFDPSISPACRNAYRNVRNLFTLEENGDYSFSCHTNFAEFISDDSVSGSDGYFNVYNTWGITSGGESPDGTFAPFNKATQVFTVASDGKTITQNGILSTQNQVKGTHPSPYGKYNPDANSGGTTLADTTINHYLGMTMETSFIQPENGNVNARIKGSAEKPMYFSFSGDNDVWIFIDDILVADLGGIHSEDFVTIDFTNGSIYIGACDPDDPENVIPSLESLRNGTTECMKRTSLKEMFTAAGEEDGPLWNGNTFGDNTVHTLKFFYLERGGWDNNLSLSFNLMSIPYSEILKTDQDGNPVPGAYFDLYGIDSSGQEQLLCRSRTDDNGGLIFLTDQDELIQFDYYYKKGYKKFLLREDDPPRGYRPLDDIILYYQDGIILSENYWESGAYAAAKLNITMAASDEFCKRNNDGTPGSKIDDVSDGLLFAVPLKLHTSQETFTDDPGKLHPVRGSTLTGWTVAAETSEDKGAVLTAAKQYNMTASLNARNIYSMEIDDMPGTIQEYSVFCESKEADGNPDYLKNHARYTFAFYYVPGVSSLEAVVDPDTIVRVSEQDFTIDYSTVIYVPNTRNELTVKKFDQNGNPLYGAGFSLYQLYASTSHLGYKTTDFPDTPRLYRNPDTVNENGQYKTYDEIVGNAEAWDSLTVSEEGPNTFPTIDLESMSDPFSACLEEGLYVLYETTPPGGGYLLNKTPVYVEVTKDGVFADAGKENDGIRVGQSVRSPAPSMMHFASEGAIDSTLTYLNAVLQEGSVRYDLEQNVISRTYSEPLEGTVTYKYRYSNAENRYICYEGSSDRYVTGGDNVYLYTDRGWPKVSVTQDPGGTVQTLVLKGASETAPSVTLTFDGSAGTRQITLPAANGTLTYRLKDGETLSQIISNDRELGSSDYTIFTPTRQDLQNTDLTHLFFISTVVQIYDQGTGSMTVSKQAEDLGDADTAFVFQADGLYEEVSQIHLYRDRKSDASFTGTLNARIRRTSEDSEMQDDGFISSVHFKNGIGPVHLEPDCQIESVYMPENNTHSAYGLTPYVDTRIILDSDTSGTLEVITADVRNLSETKKYKVTFTDGIGHFSRIPDHSVLSVDGKENGFSSSSRFHTAGIAEMVTAGSIPGTHPAAFEAAGKAIVTGEPTGITETGGAHTAVFSEQNDEGDTKVLRTVFALYPGQSVTFHQLAGGSVFRVTEIGVLNNSTIDTKNLSSNWTTSCSATEGSFDEATRTGTVLIRPDVTPALSFLNTPASGNLMISKKVLVPEGESPSSGKQFTFTITAKNKDTPLTGEYNCIGSTVEGSGVKPPEDTTLIFQNGIASFSLCHGQAVTICGLPKDTSCTVEENPEDGYLSKQNRFEITIPPNTTVKAAFENVCSGSVTITKRDGAGSYLTGAGFTLYEYDENGNYTEKNKIAGETFVQLCRKVSCTENDPGVTFDSAHGRITVDGTSYILHRIGEESGTTHFYYYRPLAEGEDSSGKDIEAVAIFTNLDPFKKYTIIETTVPDDYNDLGLFDGKNHDGISLPADGIYDLTYVVENHKKFHLPSAGAGGIALSVMLGVILLAAGCTILSRRKTIKM